MIKVDKESKTIILTGESDDIIEEIYNACVALCRTAVEHSDSMYIEIFGKIDDLPDKVARKIEEEYDIDWEALDEKQREGFEEQVEKIKSSVHSGREKAAMIKMAKLIFGVNEDGEKGKEKK